MPARNRGWGPSLGGEMRLAGEKFYSDRRDSRRFSLWGRDGTLPQCIVAQGQVVIGSAEPEGKERALARHEAVSEASGSDRG